jgi:hypothetical protein
MIFLLALDFLFNVQNGYYREWNPVLAVEIAINLLCLGFGPFTIVRLWQRRKTLEAQPAGGEVAVHSDSFPSTVRSLAGEPIMTAATSLGRPPATRFITGLVSPRWRSPGAPASCFCY